MIKADGDMFMLCPDDGERLTGRWDGLPAIRDAVAVIGAASSGSDWLKP